MVVRLLRSGFPFVDRSAAAFGADEVLGGDLLGEHPMLIGSIAEDGKATTIAHRDGESRMRKGLPPVGIIDDMANGPFSMDG